MSLDEAFEKFKALCGELTPRLDEITTEQDARLQIINRVLTPKPHSGTARSVMAKKMKSRLADDIRASFDELRDFIAGKKTGVVVHRVVPSASAARKARRKLGIEPKPKAVRRALKSQAS